MANYTVTTDFLAKDSLPSGNAGKVIKGADLDVEFDNIATAVATKADTASPTFTGTPAAPTAAADTNTTQIATTAYVQTELLNLSGTNVTSGTVPNARLPATIDQTTVKAVQFGAAEYDAGNSGASLTVNFNNGVNQKITLTANCTFTFSNPLAGMTAKLKLIQDGTGSRTVTWPTIKWAGGAAPTLTTTATTGTDIITLYYDGTAYWGQAGLNFA